VIRQAVCSTRRHARPEHGIRIRCDVALRSTPPVVTRRRINVPLLVRSSDPVEACCSIRPFALRLRRLVSRPVSAAGSTLLACIFEAIPKSPSSSFGSALPPPQGFSACRGRSTRETRCRIRSRDSRFAAKLKLPSGIFQSLGLNAQPVFEPRSLPCELPDRPSLPAALKMF